MYSWGMVRLAYGLLEGVDGRSQLQCGSPAARQKRNSMRKNASMVVWVVAAMCATAVSSVMAGPPPPVAAPDGGSTALLVLAAGFGLSATRRFLGRSK